MTTDDFVQLLLDRIKKEPDAIDPYAALVEADTIGVEDPDTGARWFVTVEEV